MGPGVIRRQGTKDGGLILLDPPPFLQEALSDYHVECEKKAKLWNQTDVVRIPVFFLQSFSPSLSMCNGSGPVPCPEDVL